MGSVSESVEKWRVLSLQQWIDWTLITRLTRWHSVLGWSTVPPGAIQLALRQRGQR